MRTSGGHFGGVQEVTATTRAYRLEEEAEEHHQEADDCLIETKKNLSVLANGTHRRLEV